MKRASAKKTQGGVLRVRVSRKEAGDGQGSEVLSVFCPREQRAVSVEGCAQCEDYESLYLDPGDSGSLLVCGAARAETARVTADSLPGQPSRAPSVREIMSTRVVCVRPELSVETLLGLFIDKGISGAPVVDDDGRPIGMVSKTDLLSERFLEGETMEGEQGPMRFTTEQGYEVELEGGFHTTQLANSCVGDIMTPLVFALPEGATIPQAAALMAYEGVHRAPVVSLDDRVVGVVSSLDVLRWVGRSHGFVVPDRRAHKAED